LAFLTLLVVFAVDDAVDDDEGLPTFVRFTLAAVVSIVYVLNPA
jgi:hypothetical protein